MHRQPAEVIADRNVCVVWDEDIDPLATTPLRASVRFVADSSMTHPPRSHGPDGVAIKVSATPPSRWRTGHAG